MSELYAIRVTLPSGRVYLQASPLGTYARESRAEVERMAASLAFFTPFPCEYTVVPARRVPSPDPRHGPRVTVVVEA